VEDDEWEETCEGGRNMVRNRERGGLDLICKSESTPEPSTPSRGSNQKRERKETPKNKNNRKEAFVKYK